MTDWISLTRFCTNVAQVLEGLANHASTVVLSEYAKTFSGTRPSDSIEAVVIVRTFVPSTAAMSSSRGMDWGLVGSYLGLGEQQANLNLPVNVHNPGIDAGSVPQLARVAEDVQLKRLCFARRQDAALDFDLSETGQLAPPLQEIILDVRRKWLVPRESLGPRELHENLQFQSHWR